MVRGSKAFLTALVLIAGCSVASAQEATIGAGKVEIGGFPGGGTFFTGGDGNTEVKFNVYAAGGVQLQARGPTKQFGYDVDTVGWQSFMTENVGGGIKIFRASDAPNWGFRIDYRLIFINSNSSAPAFFAHSKSRTGSRVYVGMLYTWKR